MENQTVNAPENPQPVKQLTAGHRKPFVIILILILLLLSGFFAYSFLRKPAVKPLVSQQPTPNPTEFAANRMKVTGVIRSSGLRYEEKTNLKLQYSDYQLTDFPEEQYQKLKTSGYFLESDKEEIEKNLGKCVQATGLIIPQGEVKDISYNRQTLTVETIERLNYQSCLPYEFYSRVTGAPVNPTAVYQGILIHGVRPASDINYDYRLRLIEPYLDNNNASGLSLKVEQLEIMPADDAVWQEVENNINNEVTVEGSFEWGYAESQFFRVTKVSPVTEKTPLKKVLLYYYNQKLDPDFTFADDKIMPLEREIPVSQTPIQDTIKLLISGDLTLAEKRAGFTTEFPHPLFTLQGANLKDGVLTLDFPFVPSFTTGGSSRVGLLQTSIEKTAKQFSEVKDVKYTNPNLFQP